MKMTTNQPEPVATSVSPSPASSRMDFDSENQDSSQEDEPVGDLGENGVQDMVNLVDLNESLLLENIRLRYQKELIYTFAGNILMAVNPYKQLDIYGLDVVKKYEGQILGTLPPHLFAVGSSAYSRMTKDNEDQVIIISGESGSGKTETTKLIMQYLAAVNKSASNIVTEQILEAAPMLESFGNAKTVKNNNSSRFGKYLEIHFKDGLVTGAKTTEYLLEKSRIVTHSQDERNYHVFYELLSGLSDQEKEKYGLQLADKYFYLNQGGSCEIEGRNDQDGYRFLMSAMQVLGFTHQEQDIIFRILAAVLHLGNVYFHRKQLKHGQEGVEIGSDTEVRWTSHLLQIPLEGVLKAITARTTEARNERMMIPLNIDQALDARDAIAKALYSQLFTWLVHRVNSIINKSTGRRSTFALLDIFGFEEFKENSFEQLCINFANETLHSYFNKYIFKLEQQEYAKEKIDWQVLPCPDNQAVLNLMAKKPEGIFALLDDESNFPKGTDHSFLEKCHFNFALTDHYSRPRMSSMEFGVKHFAGQVWYSVDGFLDKNRDTLRQDVMDLMVNSKIPMVSKMFADLRHHNESVKTFNRADGRFVTMKPRAATVATRFQDSLNLLVDTMSHCNPFFVRCVKPNKDKAPMKFDGSVVLDQLRYTGMLETVRIRQKGYPIRKKFHHFSARYRCLLPGRVTRTSTKDMCKKILTSSPQSKGHYQLGASKVFMRESLEQSLEKERVRILRNAVVTIQRYFRGYLARRKLREQHGAAALIQATYKGHCARKNYTVFRQGIIRAQATWRMRRQRNNYLQMKAARSRRKEADHHHHMAKQVQHKQANRKEQERSRSSKAAVADNQPEIPAHLVSLFSKLEDWNPPRRQSVGNELDLNSSLSASVAMSTKVNGLSNSKHGQGSRTKTSSLMDLPLSHHGQQMSSVPPPPPPLPGTSGPPPPPPSPPGQGYNVNDASSRAKTVRIGKWRWPPPRDDAGEPLPADSFFEFKLKKKHEKQSVSKVDDDQAVMRNAINQAQVNQSPGKTPAVSSDQEQESIALIQNGGNNKHAATSASSSPGGGSPGKLSRPLSVSDLNSKDTVGKIRISSEMKSKLEQLTFDQSVRGGKEKKDSREKLAKSMDDITQVGKVKKLSEQRKALLEKQLMGSLLVSNKTDSSESKENLSDTKSSSTNLPDDGLVMIERRFAPNRRSQANRDHRERRDELGPHGRSGTTSSHGPGTVTSMAKSENGDLLCHSVANMFAFLDDLSTKAGSVYEESIASMSVSTRRDLDFALGRPSDERQGSQSKAVKRMSVPPPPPPEDGAKERDIPSPSLAPSSSFFSPSAPQINNKLNHSQETHSFMDSKSASQCELRFNKMTRENIFSSAIDVSRPSKHQRTEYGKLRKQQNGSQLAVTESQTWEIRDRKEVFSPGEQLDKPASVHLVFCQVVRDAFCHHLIRLTKHEKERLKGQLASLGISPDNVHSSSHKLATKRKMIELCKELPTYFSQLYPVDGGRNLANVNMLGISHSGVRLILRVEDNVCDYLRVIDTLNFDDITDITVRKRSTLQLCLKTGGWITLFTPKADEICNLIERFSMEAIIRDAELVRAIEDHYGRDSQELNFTKGDVIRIIRNKNVNVPPGWTFGVLESGEGGIFPATWWWR
ncbi:Unconventional myosin-XV [Halotydeus destructor]|nr:Unconventional myosin-XV [Halotydeus destructor]